DQRDADRERFDNVRRHEGDQANHQQRTEVKHDRTHEGARRDAALRRKKARADRCCDEQQRHQRRRSGAEQHVKVMPVMPFARHEPDYPRPTKGIRLAITVMNRTLVSSGRLAMYTTARPTSSAAMRASIILRPSGCSTPSP